MHSGYAIAFILMAAIPNGACGLPSAANELRRGHQDISLISLPETSCVLTRDRRELTRLRFPTASADKYSSVTVRIDLDESHSPITISCSHPNFGKKSIVISYSASSYYIDSAPCAPDASAEQKLLCERARERAHHVVLEYPPVARIMFGGDKRP